MGPIQTTPMANRTPIRSQLLRQGIKQRFGSEEDAYVSLQRMNSTIECLEAMLEEAIGNPGLSLALRKFRPLSEAEKGLLLEVAHRMDQRAFEQSDRTCHESPATDWVKAALEVSQNRENVY